MNTARSAAFLPFGHVHLLFVCLSQLQMCCSDAAVISCFGPLEKVFTALVHPTGSAEREALMWTPTSTATWLFLMLAADFQGSLADGIQPLERERLLL